MFGSDDYMPLLFLLRLLERERARLFSDLNRFEHMISRDYRPDFYAQLLSKTRVELRYIELLSRKIDDIIYAIKYSR